MGRVIALYEARVKLWKKALKKRKIILSFLWACSSVVEQFTYNKQAAGSIPAMPTSQ